MNFRLFMSALGCVLAVAALCGRAGLAQTPAPAPQGGITVTDGDITDRPYRVLGDVSVSIRKQAIVEPSMEGRIEAALRAKAQAMHADAVVQVRTETSHEDFFSLGDVNATGRAVSFQMVASQNPGRPGAAASSGAQSPSQAEMKAKLQYYVQSINAGNAAAAAALYADDATIEDPVGSAPRRGRREVDSFLQAVVARGVKYEPIAPIIGSNVDVAGMTIKAHSGPTVLNAIELFTFNADGKIRSMTAYWGSEDRSTGQ